MSFVDGATAIKTILAGGWVAANTDNMTPAIVLSDEVKRKDGDIISIYLRNFSPEKNSIGHLTRRRIDTIAIDVYCCQGTRTHWIKLINEADRILNTKIVNPSADYDILSPDMVILIPENYPQFHHAVMECKLIKTNETR